MFQLKKIGVVKSEFKVKKHPDSEWLSKLVSEVIVEEQYGRLLDGIEEYSHLIILYWAHGVSEVDRETLRMEPKPGLPKVGVLATRIPVRPNPICLSIVELVEKGGNRLIVRGLDAIDGSPVIDVKPYLPDDSKPSPRVPKWLRLTT